MKSVFTREYGQFLAALIDTRKAKHLSQQELAARPGKPQSFVSKYERGERRLDVIEFLYVACALGLSATEIISDLESKPPAPGEGAQ